MRSKITTRFFLVVGVAAITGTVVLLKLGPTHAVAQAPPNRETAPTAPGPAAKTPWGEPDLQGIWTLDLQVPLERPARYANKEFLTKAEIAEIDRQRVTSPRGVGDKRAPRGTEQDVSGAYNSVFLMRKHTGRRTSLIVDPPDGRIPPLTTEATKR